MDYEVPWEFETLTTVVVKLLITVLTVVKYFGHYSAQHHITNCGTNCNNNQSTNHITNYGTDHSDDWSNYYNSGHYSTASMTRTWKDLTLMLYCPMVFPVYIVLSSMGGFTETNTTIYKVVCAV